MYTLGYRKKLPDSVKFIFDYYPVYIKLRDLLEIAEYRGIYSNYSQDDFEELIPELIYSYFSVDRREANTILYSALTSLTPDNGHEHNTELILADSALDILETIDSLTKLHIPTNVSGWDSPFDKHAILDVRPLGHYRMIVEITKNQYDELKRNVIDTANISEISSRPNRI